MYVGLESAPFHMKKYFGSATFMALFALYSLYHYPDSLAALNTTSGSSANTAVTTSSTGTLATTFGSDEDGNQLDEYGEDGSQSQPTQTQPAPTPTPTPTPKPVPVPTPAPKPKGQYVDGTYTGSSVYVYYGNVQVRATVSGGKLADVQFIQYPNDRNTSRYINSQAMPLLRSEAIQAQSANVDGVSGASDTSAGFRESLAAALSKARS